MKETPETKEMLQNSVNLHEFVGTVYKKEYLQLAERIDAGAPSAEIETTATKLHVQYYEKYRQLAEQLFTSGKIYAAKNGIQVQEVNPSPNL